jgi:periplasmic nitrate reductase NapD
MITAAATDVHISSALAHVRPEAMAEVARTVAALGGVEVHFADAGKIILTLEAASSADIADRLAEIGRQPGVLAATLVYHEVTTTDALGEPLCS